MQCSARRHWSLDFESKKQLEKVVGDELREQENDLGMSLSGFDKWTMRADRCSLRGVLPSPSPGPYPVGGAPVRSSDFPHYACAPPVVCRRDPGGHLSVNASIRWYGKLIN